MHVVCCRCRCAEVDLRVYVVPTENSSMGSYLACVDPWYRKQVRALHSR